MAYAIEWTARALHELRKLDASAARRILTAVARLAGEPRPPGARALAGEPSGVFMLRVGDYRVIYQVEDDRIVVTVVRVAHRRETYRKA